MLLVGVNRLRAGMVTAVPVLHPRRSSTRLVQSDYALNAEMISRLHDLGVPHVWIKHPLLKDLDQIVLSQVPEHRRAVYDTIKAGFDKLQHRVITPDDYRRYRQVIGSLVTELIGRNGKAGDMAERLFTDGDELANHSSNVAYLSVTVALNLEHYIGRERGRNSSGDGRDLTSLGVGAMLHDMGKLQASPELRGMHESTGRGNEEYEKHVVDGFKGMRGHINPVASSVALQHHQRWDGGGWPDMTELTNGRYVGGLSGRRIHIFARIVAVANAFDTLSARGQDAPMPAIYALKMMQSGKYSGAFDPIVLDAFLRYVPPFPTGVEVVLNNGRPAAVMQLNPEQPCRPKVRPLDDESDSEDIDLTQHPELHICESQGANVVPWLYHLPSRNAVLAAAESVR